MASIRQLKKDINNEIGAIIEDIYHWELSNPKADLTKSEQLIDEAIVYFDTLIQQVNAVKGENTKKQFSSILSEKEKNIKVLLNKFAKL
ncbi:MAG: hypothetical protein CNC91_02275 [Flavobacteriales bacterium MED-G22]|nr:MAG: hypothetical protein CNC91_02275 [Flavobacteriales bacterium MED-G22]|tara:strand:- start:617 stop:883 length:267 start_codon:yes stop_codon:yes gene_type:complete